MSLQISKAASSYRANHAMSLNGTNRTTSGVRYSVAIGVEWTRYGQPNSVEKRRARQEVSFQRHQATDDSTWTPHNLI
jgi:hypothetical protein